MSSDQQPCIICANPKAKRCTSCRSSAYCSTVCQKQDWKIHRLLCKQLQDTISTRPTPAHRLCILLPKDEGTPRLVWLDSSEEVQQREIESLLGEPRPQSTFLQDDARSNHELHHSLVLRSRNIGSGDSINQCITTLIRGSEKHNHRGPVLALALESNSGTLSDISLGDFRVVVDHLITPPPSDFIDLDSESNLPDGYIRAVRINCLGDQRGRNEPPYKAIGIRSDNISYFPRTSSIPSHLGLPIVVKRLRPDPTWHDRWLFDNVPATWLHIDCDTESKRWGWAPPTWQSEVGSIVIARCDGKDISPLQAEVLCDYCQRVLGSEFEVSLETRNKQPVLRGMTPQAFSRAFAEYKADRIANDPRWAREQCPVV
ncbi:hypothetical protein AC578_3269 [Pseudocercospora eumusae]|uniref:MYND-type domain-containing protein n=1 Tax=Pseudocercospora eumusae TaxID=321146 RepID=A0A139GZJ1_9PEZI|nr:hypothetical protein AC578_3269 [Pseudocercospora eumusae]